ncbi:unnamed protein product [Schistosoma mattheei]|uniref:Uncharacterized protein n=1 Tax=Schistosoma mattheei TaxID=31246 RepID=A0A183NZY4_9TREM|nr:unnamed protein product [Schistosoma mattheei]
MMKWNLEYCSFISFFKIIRGRFFRRDRTFVKLTDCKLFVFLTIHELFTEDNLFSLVTTDDGVSSTLVKVENDSETELSSSEGHFIAISVSGKIVAIRSRSFSASSVKRNLKLFTMVAVNRLVGDTDVSMIGANCVDINSLPLSEPVNVCR